MSLKAVHLFFVTVLSAMTFGCAAWKLRSWRSDTGSPADLVFGAGALLLGVLVIVYGRYFLKKLRAISYL